MIHELRVPLAWHWIEKVRQAVGAVLHDESEDLREAAVMVASELAENLVKYGQPVDGEDSGRIAIEVADGYVSISSENGTTVEEAAKVQALVQSIGDAPDVQGLYLTRLTKMATTPGDSASELGLLRIAFEGRFSLTAEYKAPRLLLIARRKVAE
jgi:hypothetical protein